MFLAYGSEVFDRLPLIFGFALISLAPGLLELGGFFPPQIIYYLPLGFSTGLLIVEYGSDGSERARGRDCGPPPPPTPPNEPRNRRTLRSSTSFSPTVGTTDDVPVAPTDIPGTTDDVPAAPTDIPPWLDT